MQVLIYLLQASLSLAGFAGLYALLLQKETYYRWNRWFFWLAGMASLVIPAWNGWLSQKKIVQQVTTYVPDLSFQYDALQQTQSSYPSLELILLSVWGAGVLWMTFRLLRQLSSVHRLYQTSEPSVVEEQAILIPARTTAPFSFFRWIFVNPAQFNAQELREVVLHERVHAEQGHSWDVIMGELLQIVFWFNPLVKWWVKIIHQNLEYLADYGVLSSGLNARHYQYHLLRQSGLAIPVGNHFNVSELKNRIRQINTPSSAPWKSAKLLLIFPVLLFWLMAFTPRQVLEEITIHTIAPAPVPLAEKTVQEQGIASPKPKVEKISPTRKVRSSPEENTKKEYYLNEKQVSQKGIEQIKVEEIKSVNVMKAQGAEKDGVNQVKISLRNTGPETDHPLEPSIRTPIYMVDGKQTTDLSGINPDDIKEMHVLKGATAMEQYGLKAKDGVIVVFLKPKN